MYDAFISYRRREPDRSVAGYLHSRLEAFRVPAPLVRRGVRRQVGSIFLDDQELEAGSLSGAIRRALSQSRYLFVVCSPETPKSSWIAEEVGEFRCDHTADKVRCLLWDRDAAACLPAGVLPPAGPAEPPAPAFAPQIVRLEQPDSGRHGMTPQVEMQLLALLLGCETADLEQAVAQRSRLRRAALAVAGVVLAAGTVASVVRFNTKDSWHTVRQPQPGLAAGPFPKAFVLGQRVLSRNAAGLPQVLRFQGAVPRVERAFAGLAGPLSDSPGPFSPGLRRQLVAVRSPTGTWTAQVIDLESGTAFATPAGVDAFGHVFADFAGSDDLVYFLPDRMEPGTVSLYSLSGRREIARIPGVSAKQPWLNLPGPFDPWTELFRPGLGLWASPRFLIGPRQVDGRQAAALWDPQRPAEPLHLLAATEHGQMRSYAVDPRGELVAVLEVERETSGVISVWNLRTGERTARRELASWSGFDIAFTGDGRHVLAGGSRFEILRRDGLVTELDSGDTRWVLVYPLGIAALDPLRRLRIAPLLVQASRSGETMVTMLDAPQLPPRSLHLDLYAALDWRAEPLHLFPNQARDLLLSIRRQQGDLWDLGRGRHLWSIPMGDASYAVFSVDGSAFATVSPAGAVRLVETATGRRLTDLSLAGNVGSVVLAYDRHCERASLATGWEQLWISHGQELFGRFSPRVQCGAFPPQ